MIDLLGNEYGEYASKAPHLHEYAHAVHKDPALAGIQLQFKPSLSRELRLLKKFSIIYPASDNIFVHVFKGVRDPYGRYRPIEPRLPPDKKDLIDKTEVMLASMINDKVAQQIAEKIAEGKMNSFFAERVLLDQEFFNAGVFKGTIANYVKQAGVELTDYVRVEVGQ